MPSFDLASENDTARLGARLAGLARPGDVLALSGGLGAGKTALARAFIRAYLGNPQEEVPSPTFTLAQIYEGEKGQVWHLDLYRLEKPDDALELGIEEAFQDAVSLIEWPERLGALLPARALHVDLAFGAGEGERRAQLTGWRERLDA
ncbi:MAG: tRNA (adenosine(37)-N6)-threonylcarbamoyltransferase complex ATPase subunit type 1 TsaE [Rhodospirillales bacterium]|nr:MAG: tRNA (adenosine(37)-N6)-threonylcarbamoyltransferase complex ATPase subunit type 1 TsaE [Rhodospirillales bacterium]